MNTEHPFCKLHKVIRRAFNATKDTVEEICQELSILLNSYKPQILNLLQHPARDANDRKTISSGEVVLFGTLRQLSPEFIKVTLKLSDYLKLNEVNSAELLHSAVPLQNRLKLSHFETAIRLCYSERQYLIQCLYDCVVGSADTDLHPEIQGIFSYFVDELVYSSLPSNSLISNDPLPSHTTVPLKIIYILDSLRQLSQDLMEYQKHEEYKNIEEKVHLMRYGLIKTERKLLVQLLFQISYQRHLSESEILRCLKSLRQQDGNDTVTIYMMFALMASIDTQTQENGESLLKNFTFIRLFNQEINAGGSWINNQVYGTLLVQWALFLTTSRESFPLEQELRITEEMIDQMFVKGVQTDSFVFINQFILTLKKDDDLNDQFLEYIWLQLDIFVSTIIRKMFSVLIYLKQQQEQEELTNAAAVRRDFEQLINIISVIYSSKPDMAISFWDEDDYLFNFIKYAGDCNSVSMILSFLSMLSALSTGEKCAEYCHEFLKNSKYFSRVNSVVSWNMFVMVIDKCNAVLRNENAVHEINPSDLQIIELFLEVLYKIVFYSKTARLTIYENPQWKILTNITSLLGTKISVNLKASILNTMRAFCQTPELVPFIWQHLEQSHILSTNGILYELDEIETRNETYVQLRAFLNLLNALVRHGMFPENLGVGYRTPGVAPYFQFVIEHVLLKHAYRPYRNASEMYLVNEQCLEFIKLVLNRWKEENYPVNHYGLFLMKHILSNSKVTSEILKPLCSAEDIYQDYNNLNITSTNDNSDYPGRKLNHPRYRHLLEIIEFITENQFLVLKEASTLASIEQILLIHKSALSVMCYMVSTNSSIKVLKILDYLCTSKFMLQGMNSGNRYHKLAQLIGASEYFDMIMSVFVNRLEGNDNVEDDEDELNHTKSNSQLLILDLLIKNLEEFPAIANLAHVLLGFNTRALSATVIHDPSLPTTKVTLFNVVIDRLVTNASNGYHHITPFDQKCQELIFRLSTGKQTSKPLLSFIRNYADNLSVESIKKLVYLGNDEPAHKLLFYSYLFRQIALEMNYYTNHGHRVVVSRMIEELYAISNSMNQQPFVQIIEVMDHFPLSIRETSLSEALKVTKFIEYIDFTNFEVKTSEGSIHYDIRGVYQHLKNMIEESEAKKSFNGPNIMESFMTDVQHLLNTMVKINAERDYAEAVTQLWKGWRHVLEISLINFVEFQGLVNIQSGRLVELVNLLLIKLNSCSPRLAEPISKCILSVAHKVLMCNEFDTTESAFQSFDIRFVIEQLLVTLNNPLIGSSVRGTVYTLILILINSDDSGTFVVLNQLFYKNQSEKWLEIVCKDAIDSLDVWKVRLKY
jgi:nuclear pore complex protein Nup205